MDKLDPKNSPGFFVGRIAHRLQVHISNYLIDSGINLTTEKRIIIMANAKLDFVISNLSSMDSRVVLISIANRSMDFVESTLSMSYALA